MSLSVWSSERGFSDTASFTIPAQRSGLPEGESRAEVIRFIFRLFCYKMLAFLILETNFSGIASRIVWK